MSIVSIWEQIVAVNIWQQWQSQQQRWWDDTITIKAKFKTYGTSLFSADFLLLELQECMEKRDVEKRLNYVISFHFIFFVRMQFVVVGSQIIILNYLWF